MKKVYNKLVRDKIPEIIENRGAHCETDTLSEESFKIALDEKLKEEINEFLASHDVEELADVLQVIYAILDVRGLQISDVISARIQKEEERGTFQNRVYLKYVEEED